MTSYTDSAAAATDPVQAGVTYYYRVEATNSAGSSAFSNAASAELVLPTVSVSALDPNATAAGPDGNPQDAWFKVTRSGDPSGTLTVDFGLSGTEPTNDYTVTDEAGNAIGTTFEFPAGVESAVVCVAPKNAATETATDDTVVANVNPDEGDSEVASATATDNIADTPNPNGTTMIRVDGNRDGTVEMSDEDQTTAQNPYWFWTAGDMPVIGPDGNTDGPSADTDNMENLTRLDIQVPSNFVSSSLQDAWTMKLELTPTAGAPSINLFELPTPDANNVDYLTLSADEQALAGEPRVALVGVNPVSVPLPDDSDVSSFANFDSSKDTLHYLFSGDIGGSGTLTVKFFYVNKLVSSDSTYIKLTNVQAMYEHWSAGTPGLHVDPLNPSSPNVPVTATELSAATDAQLPNANQAIVFVHGWRLTGVDSDTFSNTAFKRLFWQGSQARFISFTWPTDYTDFLDWSDPSHYPSDPSNFDRSEYQAYSSGSALLNLLGNVDARFGGYQNVDLFAHSMGNVVASEALRQAALSNHKVVNAYVATQAAVAADAYDANQFRPLIWLKDPFVPYDTGDIYEDFAMNGDGNRLVPGSPYFSIDIRATNKMTSFFNIQDFATSKLWAINESLKPDSGAENLTTDSAFSFNVAPTGLLNLDNAYQRYEAFAFAARPDSLALGADAQAGGPFTGSVNLQQFFSGDDPANFDGYPDGHSAEFYSTDPKRKYYWNQMANALGVDNIWTEDLQNIAYGTTSN